jgi:hypothetical protein
MGWLGRHPFAFLAAVGGIAAVALIVLFTLAPQGALCPASPWWSNGECFEWWLNRYQILIASLIALISAVAVVSVLAREQRRQRGELEDILHGLSTDAHKSDPRPAKRKGRR